MKKSNKSQLLPDIMMFVFWLVIIVSLCMAVFSHDWTRAIFFLLVGNFMYKVDQE